MIEKITRDNWQHFFTALASRKIYVTMEGPTGREKKGEEWRCIVHESTANKSSPEEALDHAWSDFHDHASRHSSLDADIPTFQDIANQIEREQRKQNEQT